jgi:hypothetical protein
MMIDNKPAKPFSARVLEADSSLANGSESVTRQPSQRYRTVLLRKEPLVVMVVVTATAAV